MSVHEQVGPISNQIRFHSMSQLSLRPGAGKLLLRIKILPYLDTGDFPCFLILFLRPAKEVREEGLEFLFAAFHVELDTLVCPSGSVLFGERHIKGCNVFGG